MNIDFSKEKRDLAKLCDKVRNLCQEKDYEQCEKLIVKSMSLYPHSPQPHNLIGIVLEKKGDHVGAMKHFRAAWALDPTYIPTRHNLDIFASFYSRGRCAFDEKDCVDDDWGI